jgi:outer membrane protein OmpA-like peptidoglycan-associated protein
MELRLVAAAPLAYPLSEVAHRLLQGFGATRPLADTAVANGRRALRRRVEIALAK